MSDSNDANAIRQFLAVFRRMLSTGRKVAAEDAAKAVKTSEGFDRRGFGPYVAQMRRDGEIEYAGFRESGNAKHHSNPKRLWVLAGTNKNGGAGHE
ncbi:hypothetical protein Enr13x_48560 [Stieleria neptunia]|uniref:Uncharacterized protein n=1 Tax=Stieleria neptunia TaxID=2527979 RepID=A0A518HVY6_9BACT|nr:hypothetical protein [Stieleria neptunia]QDV44983.1 hypothetical protein Enr13x_48560 [Stieleria neptunia]